MVTFGDGAHHCCVVKRIVICDAMLFCVVKHLMNVAVMMGKI